MYGFIAITTNSKKMNILPRLLAIEFKAILVRCSNNRISPWSFDCILFYFTQIVLGIWIIKKIGWTIAVTHYILDITIRKSFTYVISVLWSLFELIIPLFHLPFFLDSNEYLIFIEFQGNSNWKITKKRKKIVLLFSWNTISEGY